MNSANVHVNLTQDAPAVFLHRVVPDGELVEVATGHIIQPLERNMHNRPMDPSVMKVRLASVVSEFRDILPPIQPPGHGDEMMILGDCTLWVMTWPKTQIRLGAGTAGLRRNTGATSPMVRPNKFVWPPKQIGLRKVPNVVAPRRKRRSSTPPPTRNRRSSPTPGRNRWSLPPPHATKSCWERYHCNDRPKDQRQFRLYHRHRSRHHLRTT